MLSHLCYLSYVLRHKWHVLGAGLSLDVPLWRLLIHDWTKFSPAEWGPYVRRFCAGRGSAWEKEADPREFHRAWEHHWTRNPHHHEYWRIGNPRARLLLGLIDKRNHLATDSDRNPPEVVGGIERSASGARDDLVDVLPMPETYVREMVADWIGAGRAQGKTDTATWYAQHSDRMLLHPSTRALVERLLGEAQGMRLIR